MKSSTKEVEVKVEYPRLVIYTPSGLIVLETKPKTGFVVHTTNDYNSIGEFRTDWATQYSSWQVYNGSVVLEN